MKYAKEYGRKKILERGMQFKQGWMDVHYSLHAKERLKQRLKGSVALFPNKVNVTTLNINKGYSYDGNYLHKVIIRLEWKADEWMFLVILPTQKLVKSLWFEKKRRRVGTNAGDVGSIASGESVQIVPEESVRPE